MFLPSIIAELPTPAVDLITATDEAGGAVMVFDTDDRIIWANPAQRSLMPCGNYDSDETYESLFWKLLESGLNGNQQANSDPHKWLSSAIAARESSPNLHFINSYRWGRMLVSHLRMEDGTSIQARLDVRQTGLNAFLDEYGGGGILFALRCKHRIDALETSLNGLSLAVAIVDDSGRVLVQNASFRDMICRRDGLQISDAAGLVATDPYDDMTLHQAIRNATSGTVRSAVIPLRRPAGPPILMAIATGEQPNSAVLVLSRFGEDESSVVSSIRNALGTTPAEAEVAYGIGAGRSTAEIAERRGTTEATVYVQLKRIRAALRSSGFASADLAGIAALVTRVAAVIPPASQHHN